MFSNAINHAIFNNTINALTTDRKSATVNSPFAKHHFDKVAPQTGDILIAPSTPRPKSRFFARKKKNDSSISMIENTSSPTAPGGKLNRGRLIQFGLIFGGIALVGLVVFTIVMVIGRGGGWEESSGVAGGDTAQTAYSKYLNYIVDGSDDATPAADAENYLLVSNIISFGSSNVKAAEIYVTEDDKTAYLDALHDKYGEFASLYSGPSVDVLYKVDLFYYNYLKIPVITEDEILKTVSSEGKDAALEKISEATVSTYLDHAYNNYLEAYNTYLVAVANLSSDGISSGCVSTDLDVNVSCAQTLSSYAQYKTAYQNYRTAYNKYFDGAKDVANSILYDIFVELYGGNSANEEEGDEL